MVGIKNIAVNIKREALLFDFFVDSKEDFPLLIDIISSKYLSVFVLNEIFIDEEEYQKYFINRLYPAMTKHTKFGKENNIIVQRYMIKEEEYISISLNKIKI